MKNDTLLYCVDITEMQLEIDSSELAFVTQAKNY